MGAAQSGLLAQLPRRPARNYGKFNVQLGNTLEAPHFGDVTDDHARIDEIEKEMAFLTKAMDGGKGLGGHQRKAGNKRKNVRDAFRNAVDRAIKQIEKFDKPPAGHLKTSISHGNEVVYRPGLPITWDVRPIVNGYRTASRAPGEMSASYI